MGSDFTINELSALSGLSVRTIRYYIAQGLIPSAGREGPATRYPESTLARLRLIRKFQNLHLPLAEIRRQLAEIPDETAIDLAAAPEAPAPTSSALDYVRSILAAETPADYSLTPPQAPLRPVAPAAAPPPPAAPSIQQPPPLASMRMAGIQPPVEASIPEPAGWQASTPPTTPPQSPVGERSQWERISLGPDIELHVRRPLSRRDNKMVERLIAFARQLQGGQDQ